MLEAYSSGWYSSDKTICAGCVADEYLANIVRAAKTDDEPCSFCRAQPAADFDVFMEAFMVGVHNEYEQADDAGMPWDEGSYVFETYEHWDLPDQFDVAGGDYADQVVAEMRDRLVEKTYASRWWLATDPQMAHSLAWQRFCTQLKHRTRFVFWASKQSEPPHYLGAGDISAAHAMDAIGRLVEEFDLLTTYPIGTRFLRGRGHHDPAASANWGAPDLGTNRPQNSMTASRMSPAGIALFYGAVDPTTALDELRHADDRPYVTVGTFEITMPITVVDLTKLPSIPSIFDPELGPRRGHIAFLHALVEELRKPVDNARSNLDYVPTQVFCEYFLRVFKEAQIDGIAWRSAASPGEGLCVALDITHEDCLEPGAELADRPQLRFVAESKSVFRRATHFDEIRGSA